MSSSSTAVRAPMRQSTLHFPLSHPRHSGGGRMSESTSSGEALDSITLHLSLQGFHDTLWVLVTEDENCAPGVVIRVEPEDLVSRAVYYDAEVPAVECAVLLGLRDHPLTNLLASTLAHTMRKYGEQRPLLLCLSVVRTARHLHGPEEKKAFLSVVREQVMELAKGGGEGG